MKALPNPRRSPVPEALACQARPRLDGGGPGVGARVLPDGVARRVGMALRRVRPPRFPNRLVGKALHNMAEGQAIDGQAMGRKRCAVRWSL